MQQNLGPEVAALAHLTVAELRLRYAEAFGESTHTGNKTWLIKRIAWRLQALFEGDLSERARRRAAELANDADLRMSPPKSAALATATAENLPMPSKPDARLPPPGSTLLRPYKGRMLQVRVLNVGFEFEKTAYPSLSAVARAITGAQHCNGFLFFRLNGRGAS
jgi:hypothetical protein